MKGIIGHDEIRRFFDLVIENGRISHAYYFAGPEHVGKRRVAEALAAKLLKVPEERLRVHPDFKIVEQEFDEKKGKTKRDIDVDQAEQLRAFISLRPFLGGYKVAIIDGAERLNVHSANALLKTVEEPSAKTVMFFLTIDEDQLPRTIRSRCQGITFQPVPDVVLAEGLKALGMDDSVRSDAHGLPGLALCWSENPEVYQTYRETKQEFERLLGTSFVEKCKQVEAYFESGDDHIAARGEWQTRLDIWQLAAREQYGKALSPAVYLESLRRMRKASTFLEENVHPRLTIEHILLALP